jgi:hypothetical protein
MASLDDLRAAALRLPRAYEDTHRGAPAFRVANRKFALIWRETGQLIMKLPPGRQLFLFEVRPEIFQPIKIGTVHWSLVALERLDPDELARLAAAAWSTVVSKALAGQVLGKGN